MTCILVLILEISGEIIEVYSDIFFLNSARRQIPLFANKKKDLVRIELTFLQEVSIIVRVKMKPRWYFFFHFCSSTFLSSRSNTYLSFFK